jgi:hypothetical protein
MEFPVLKITGNLAKFSGEFLAVLPVWFPAWIKTEKNLPSGQSLISRTGPATNLHFKIQYTIKLQFRRARSGIQREVGSAQGVICRIIKACNGFRHQRLVPSPPLRMFSSQDMPSGRTNGPLNGSMLRRARTGIRRGVPPRLAIPEVHVAAFVVRALVRGHDRYFPA